MSIESTNVKQSVFSYRPITDSDIPDLVLLNNEAVPAVPEVTGEQMKALIDQASWGIVSELGSEVAGFVLCFTPGADYESENYRYFENRFSNHFYIDRIVVSSRFRGQGVGGALYDRVFLEAKNGDFSPVTCEVNVEPPNPSSMAFHKKMGFRNLETQATKGGQVIVQLMAAEVGR